MKSNKIIILSIISVVLTSCLSENYRFITRVERNGSCWREIHTVGSKNDSISGLFPYNLSAGWNISQTDTLVGTYSLENKKIYKQNIKVGKKFNSVDELSNGLRSDMIFPIANETLKKRFRWFYTYYAFTAVYPEVTEKGRVPMEQYLDKAEQKFYLQGDMSAYKGMNGWELKEVLEDIENRFMKWYQRSLYEESFDVILYYTENDFRSKLPAVKDSLFSINEKQMKEQPSLNDVYAILDNYFVINYFSNLFFENEQEMQNMIDEQLKVATTLLNYEIQYELTMPGKLMATNSYRQNDGALVWKVNMFNFLADDYTLTAESRTANMWVFVVTLLLIVFSGYCFIKNRKPRIY